MVMVLGMQTEAPFWDSLVFKGIDEADVEAVMAAFGTVEVVATGRATEAACPDCGRFSNRVHDRCQRRLKDLPLAEQGLVIRLTVRRFIRSPTGSSCGRASVEPWRPASPPIATACAILRPATCCRRPPEGLPVDYRTTRRPLAGGPSGRRQHMPWSTSCLPRVTHAGRLPGSWAGVSEAVVLPDVITEFPLFRHGSGVVVGAFGR